MKQLNDYRDEYIAIYVDKLVKQWVPNIEKFKVGTDAVIEAERF